MTGNNAGVPRVSVVMPVKDGEKFLKQAVDSILNQEFADFELIIINDGSIDSTGSLLSLYTDHRITVLTNQKNQGIAKSLNRGIAASLGEFVVRMDADDIMFPWRLAFQVAFMDKNPKVDIADGRMVQFVDEKALKPLSRPKFDTIEKFSVKKLTEIQENMRTQLFFDTCLSHPTIIARRHVFDNSAYPDLPYAEDYALWTNLVDRFQFASISEYLLYYRWHAAQSLHKLPLRAEFVARNIKLPYLQKYFPEITPANKELLVAFFSSNESLEFQNQKHLVETMSSIPLFTTSRWQAELSLFLSKQKSPSLHLVLTALSKSWRVWFLHQLLFTAIKEYIRSQLRRRRKAGIK